MTKKIIGLLILLLIYIAAYFGGFGIFILLPADMHILFKLLIADIAATVVIWIFSIIFNSFEVLISTVILSALFLETLRFMIHTGVYKHL